MLTATERQHDSQPAGNVPPDRPTEDRSDRVLAVFFRDGTIPATRAEIIRVLRERLAEREA